MSSIDPLPRAGPPPEPLSPTSGRPALAPVARPLSIPAMAGGAHAAGLGDYIALGAGIAAIGALGFAAAGAAGAAGATEGLAVGAAALLKNAATAAKAYGPQLVEDWRAGAAGLTNAADVGRFAAKQTTAAASDFARTAVIGGGLSAGAALTRHVAHALAPARAPASSPAASPGAPARLEP